MAKFKVGDTVRVIDDIGGGVLGDIATVVSVARGRHGQYTLCYLDGLSDDSRALYEERLELVSSGFIPTIRTRREIVPGIYGPVEVGGMNENRRIYLRVVGDAYKADDIREIIHIASQVLEALEEDAR